MVFENEKVKTLEGKNITGSIFMEMVEQYCSLLADGSIDVLSAHESIVHCANEKASREAKTMFEDGFLNGFELPVSEDTFSSSYESARAAAIDLFIKKSISIDKYPHFKQGLDETMEKLHKQKNEENRTASFEKTNAMLCQLYDDFGLNDFEKFMRPGGSKEFSDLIQQMMESFETNEEELGPCRNYSFNKFMEDKVDKNFSIIVSLN